MRAGRILPVLWLAAASDGTFASDPEACGNPSAVAGRCAGDPLGGLSLLQGASQARRLHAEARPAGAAQSWPARRSALSCEDSEVDFSEELRSERYFWGNKNGNAACSGTSQYRSATDVSKGPTWSFKDETASIVRAHPVIDDDLNVYVLHVNGKLRKFDETGRLLWTNEVNFDAQARHAQAAQFAVGAPVLMDGAVYVGTLDGYVTCVDMASGASRWRARASESAGSDAWSLAGRAGVVLAAGRGEAFKKSVATRFGGNDQVVALNGSTGEVLWRWQLPTGRPLGLYMYNWLASIVDDPPSAVFADSAGRPYRVRLCDGSTVWEGDESWKQAADGSQAGFSTGGAAVGPNGLVYVTSNTDNGTATLGRLSAFNAATGKLAWTRGQGMPANAAPSIGRLGPSSNLSVVIALGQNTGLPDPVAEASGAWRDGQRIAWKSEVLAFDALTGEPTRWRWAPPDHKRPQSEGDEYPDHICLPDAWSNSAIDGSGAVYLGHMSGNLFVLRDIDGNGKIDESRGEVSKYYGGRCYQGSPGLAPDLLVATPCDGVHVFRERPR